MSDLAGGPQRFIDDMAKAGIEVRVDGARLTYEVLAVGGSLSGQLVPTGVSLSEVQNWPQIPPHWVHLPDTVTLEPTNCDVVDCPSGWRRHSREFQLTDTSVAPALVWIRHVRGLLSLAVSTAA